MIKPIISDDAFLADVSRARSERAAERLFVWWLGQSGFLVCYRGECLLFDPYLSDSLTRKYAATDKPHVRMTERVVDPARLDFVSVVTTSHNHTDHLDAETLLPLLHASVEAKLVGAAANRAFVLQRLGAAARDEAHGRTGGPPVPTFDLPRRLVTLAESERATVGAFTLEAVPAAHEELKAEFAGFVASVGPFRVYHSGDTVRFPGMVERLRPLGVDLALLPINGSAPERRVAGNLNGREAAEVAREIEARWVVPCHYEMFEFNTASPAEFVATCERLGQRHQVLRAGERWVLTKGA